MSHVSKAIAGALASVLIAFLAQYDIRLGGEHKDAIELLLNGVLAAGIGYVTVYLAPRNKETTTKL